MITKKMGALLEIGYYYVLLFPLSLFPDTNHKRNVICVELSDLPRM